MPKKKRIQTEVAAEVTGADTTAESTTATLDEPATAASTPVERPAWVDGPPTGDAHGPDNPEARNWGEPYKPIFTTPSFELGENRRYKQRVFMFKEKPDLEVLAKLKEHGFTYRAAEKAWTITATPQTRKLTDELARDLAGPDYIRTLER